ncbi:MAG: hypothetical protein GEU73_02255 [Chloroflexi bacterium]|nr:hypothetical protein [Chloroflexota bacterium]
MKDGHRIIHGKIPIFSRRPSCAYYEMGASGCWSTFACQGPWPILALYDAVVDGDQEMAQATVAATTCQYGHVEQNLITPR